MASDVKALVEVTCAGAESFVKQIYFSMFDTKREDIFHIYRDNSVVVWNGHAILGVKAILEFFKTIPPSQHSCESMDCQPIALPGEDPSRSILVNVGGTVAYFAGSQSYTSHADKKGNSATHQFSQTFVLTLEATSSTGGRQYFVASDNFRLTS